MYQPQRQVVRRGANHTLHIVMSILTCGLWAVTVWPIAAIMGRRTKTTVYPPQQYPPAGYQQPPYGQQSPTNP
jgi:hypothetical protein